MSFDFFNEGLKKDAAPQFSKEENQFFESKLPFLDPKKTQSIPIGNALDFLKYSGLRSDRIQKILRACNVESGKKTLTYDEMKKLFRGVALAQNDIEPSTININANIKTKMPCFEDEDSEEEEAPAEKQQPPQTQPTSQPPNRVIVQNVQTQKATNQESKPQKDKLNVFQGVFPPSNAPNRSPQQLEKSNFAQFPPMQPSNHFSQSQSQKPAHENSQIANKIKQFEVKWKKLKTEGNKIDGGEVKNLCKKLSDRSILSRAWKLCCLTHTGSLTKGQFYVFLEMVSTNKIPEQLSAQMKAIIQEIDQSSKPVEKPVSTPKVNPMTPQSSSFTQLASSPLFQNFTNIEPKAKTEVRLPKQDENTQKIMNKLTEAKKLVENNHRSELTELRRGQQVMNNLMCEVEQYIVAVDNRSNSWNSQIEQLKQSQLLLNDRLNKVCQGMNAVIMKQHAIIDDLVGNFVAQNNINNQRVSMLQNYVIEIKQQLDVREQQLGQLLKQKASEKVQQTEKKVESKAQPMASPQSEKPTETHEPQSPFTEAVAENHQEESKVQVKHQEQPEQEQEQHPRNSLSRQEDPEYEQRMKSKRSQVLQLIMYITPLTQEEMPALMQRIAEYSEEQLNMVYINCYQKLQARQEMQAQRAAQLRASEQDFNTSNFKGEAAPVQDMFQ